MRRWLRSILPDHQVVRSHRGLSRFETTLLHPRLWHLNRRSVRGAVAVGLFCGLIPGPLQMISAALGALALRVNLPLALLTTLYTNPLTIVPLYFVAHLLGRWLMGGGTAFVSPPELAESEGVLDWAGDLLGWLEALGRPLLIGLPLLALLLAAVGFVAVDLLWRWVSLRRWRSRSLKRQPYRKR